MHKETRSRDGSFLERMASPDDAIKSSNPFGWAHPVQFGTHMDPVTRGGTFQVHKAMSLLDSVSDHLISLTVSLLVAGRFQIQMGDGGKQEGLSLSPPGVDLCL